MNFDFQHVDTDHLHQEEIHSDADVADLADGGVQQLSASVWPHLPQQELSPQAQPLSL